MTENIKFAIRDDDTSYFTTVAELEAAYGRYLGDVKVSLSVVPYSVAEYRNRTLCQYSSKHERHPISDNTTLCDWLRRLTEKGEIEILLHGFDHEYMYKAGRWYGEYAHKNAADLMHITLLGKNYLEELLHTNIHVFVPPSNQISKGGTLAIEHANLNISGIIGWKLDRPLTQKYITNYITRWWWWLFYQDAYPYTLDFGTRKELRTYALTPRVCLSGLRSDFENCLRNNANFVLATHYWELNAHPNLCDILDSLLEVAKAEGVDFSRLSDCY